MHKNNRSIISIAIIIQAARFEFWIHCNPFYYGPYGPSTPSIIVWFENNAWYGILLININKITYKLSNRGVQPDLVPDQPIQPGQPSPKTGRPDTADNQRWVSIPKTRFQRVGWQVWTQKNDFQPTWLYVHWKSSCSPPMGVFRRRFSPISRDLALSLRDPSRSHWDPTRSRRDSTWSLQATEISLRFSEISSRLGLISSRSAEISLRSG